jgi:UDP-N-acetylglucosamine pyrophosphorylase
MIKGAIFDERIAKILADGKADYLMEMTPRTEADVKVDILVYTNKLWLKYNWTKKNEMTSPILNT